MLPSKTLRRFNQVSAEDTPVYQRSGSKHFSIKTTPIESGATIKRYVAPITKLAEQRQ
jgi:hypothetical protein